MCSAFAFMPVDVSRRAFLMIYLKKQSLKLRIQNPHLRAFSTSIPGCTIVRNMKGNPELREFLDTLIEGTRGDPNSERWWKTDKFEQYSRALIPNELTIIAPPPPEEQNYNCYVFGFGLQDIARFVGNMNWEFTRRLDREIEEMVTLGYLVKLKKPEPGALVAWRMNEVPEICHVGIMEEGESVISKWSWGPLFRHHIYAVPASYGDTVEFYNITPEAKAFLLDKRLHWNGEKAEL